MNTKYRKDTLISSHGRIPKLTEDPLVMVASSTCHQWMLYPFQVAQLVGRRLGGPVFEPGKGRISSGHDLSKATLECGSSSING